MAAATRHVRYQIMQCPGCGAPLHYDAATDGFACLSCGGAFPFPGDDGVEETANAEHLVELNGMRSELTITTEG